MPGDTRGTAAMKNRLLAFSLAICAIGTIRAAEPATTEEMVARMKKDIYYLAGPECNGRGVGSAGIDKAAEYIAASFKASGLKGAGKDGSFFQPFTISGPTIVGSASVDFHGPNGQKLSLKPNKQFRALGLTGSGEAASGIVFAGYGITLDGEPRKYDDYAGLDVTGKVVVMFRRTPRADSKDDPFDKKENPAYASLAEKVKLAASKGAAAVAFINDSTYAKDGDALQDFRYAGAQSASKIPVVQINRGSLDHLLVDSIGKTLAEVEQAIDKDLKPRSAPLAGWTASTTVSLKKNDIACKNVVGVLEGNGPHADETIVVGAHYDHLGTSGNGSMLGAAGEGQTHWGADDNGSGTTGLIEMARRYGTMKDRQGRRIVFIAFSGEERGLHGSIHYCKEPLFPLEKTKFMLNMDMIGRVVPVDGENGKKVDRLYVYGTGTGEGFEKLADELNPGFKITKFPAGTGPSDHDSYYRKKVPVIFFFTGTHAQYHRPTDTPDLINVDGMKKVVDYGQKLMDFFATVSDPPKYVVTRAQFVFPDQGTPQARPARMSGPTLGIMPSYEEGTSGVKLDGISPGGPAEKAGLKDGDLIVEIAGKPVTNVTTYMTVMGQQKPGEEIEITVMRKSEKLKIKITPIKRN